MDYILVVGQSILVVVVTLSAVLLGGVRFTRRQRKRYPFLAKLDGKQLALAVILGVSAIMLVLVTYARQLTEIQLQGQVSVLEDEISFSRYVPLVESELSYMCMQPTQEAAGLAGRMVLSRDPYLRALGLVANREFDRAEEVLVSHPDSMSGADRDRLSAQISFYKDDLPEARRRYESALRENPYDLDLIRDYTWVLGLVGEYQLSIELNEAYYGLMTAALGESHEAAMRSRISLAESLVGGGEPEGALDILANLCTDLWEDRRGLDENIVAYCLATEGYAYLRQDNFAEAVARFEKGIDTIVGTTNCQGTELQVVLRQRLGNTYHAQSDYPAARREYEAVIEYIEHTAGPESHLLTFVLGDLGDLEYQDGNYDTAQALYERLFSLAATPVKNPFSLLLAHINLARLSEGRTEYEKAEQHYLEALRLTERHPDAFSEEDILTIESNYAAMLLQAGEVERALDMQRTSIDKIVGLHGRNHSLVVVAYENISASYRRIGELEAAEASAREAVMIARVVFGDFGVGTSDALNLLGGVLIDAGKLTEAVEVLSDALGVRTRHFGLSHLKVVIVQVKLARAWRALGKETSVRQNYEAAIGTLLDRRDEPEMRRYLGVVSEYIEYLEEIGDSRQAKVLSAELGSVE